MKDVCHSQASMAVWYSRHRCLSRPYVSISAEQYHCPFCFHCSYSDCEAYSARVKMTQIIYRVWFVSRGRNTQG